MEFNFEGKTALVTGAGKGIGRDIAIALWRAGATVYALSRTQSDLDSLVAECPGMHTLNVDLHGWDETKMAVEGIGAVDLLVNNAGIVKASYVLDISEELYHQHMDVNVKAVVNVTQTVANGMVARRSGAIVNISSICSRHHSKDCYIYSAAKAALDQLTRCQAVELGPHQIRVNSVNPTLVMTPMAISYEAEHPGILEPIINRTPTKAAAEVKDIVNATLYLLSEKAAMINGTILPVDGGYWCT